MYKEAFAALTEEEKEAHRERRRIAQAAWLQRNREKSNAYGKVTRAKRAAAKPVKVVVKPTRESVKQMEDEDKLVKTLTAQRLREAKKAETAAKKEAERLEKLQNERIKAEKKEAERMAVKEAIAKRKLEAKESKKKAAAKKARRSHYEMRKASLERRREEFSTASVESFRAFLNGAPHEFMVELLKMRLWEGNDEEDTKALFPDEVVAELESDPDWRLGTSYKVKSKSPRGEIDPVLVAANRKRAMELLLAR